MLTFALAALTLFVDDHPSAHKAGLTLALVSGDVPALIRSLGSSDYFTREAAQDRLTAIGVFDLSRVRPSLTEARTSDDLEVRRRSSRILHTVICRRSEAVGRELDRHVKTLYPQIDMLWYNHRQNRFDGNSSPAVALIYESAQPFLDAIGPSSDGDPAYARWRKAMRAWLIHQVVECDLRLDMALLLLRKAEAMEKAWQANMRLHSDQNGPCQGPS